MRTALAAKAPRGKAVFRSTSLPAPVGGWNARDSLASMPPSDAVLLENWFPDTSDVRVRKGFSKHVTSLPDVVETLMCYNEPDGTNTLFAASGSGFYDATTAGAVGAAVQSSLSNAKWYHTNFTNSGGTSYLCCFNGTDSPRYYDGSSWTTVTGASTPAITGVTTTGLIYPFVHKRRMFIIEKDTLDLWYLPVDSVGGAANKFSLAGIADKGGYLVAGGTWTLDGGEGMDDFLVAITSEGQVIVYAGTDPASDYTLIGVWDLGLPLGRRCLLKYRGGLLLALDEGLYPLTAALESSRTDPKSALTYKINTAMSAAAVSNRSNFGWQVIHFPSVNMLIFNIPSTNKEQYVMNTITGSWCKFKDIPATCWAMCGSEIYFGASTYVGKFWDTNADAGANINTDCIHAFSYLGDRGRIKKVSSIRPNFQSNGSPGIKVGVNRDFRQQRINGVLDFSGTDYFAWGDPWGSGPWGGDLSVVTNWVTTYGAGISIAPRINTESSGLTLRYSAVDILYEPGTVIA